jgi:tartrate-resistant acid phosphatase type 5
VPLTDREKVMPNYYAEPFLHLAGLTHKSALIAWGGFYFKVKSSGDGYKLVDDSDLKHVFPPRHQTVGARSESYGPARVEVYDGDGSVVSFAETTTANQAWVTGLDPDTEYTYRVFVKGDEWAPDGRRTASRRSL